MMLCKQLSALFVEVDILICQILWIVPFSCARRTPAPNKKALRLLQRETQSLFVFSGELAHQTDELTDGLLALGVAFVGCDKIPQLRLVAE